jgi:hypothetical protein
MEQTLKSYKAQRIRRCVERGNYRGWGVGIKVLAVTAGGSHLRWARTAALFLPIERFFELVLEHGWANLFESASSE